MARKSQHDRTISIADRVKTRRLDPSSLYVRSAAGSGRQWTQLSCPLQDAARPAAAFAHLAEASSFIPGDCFAKPVHETDGPPSDCPVTTMGLMGYFAKSDELFRETAGYIDKILEGAKPANLPVSFPTKFELLINVKTAKALGLTLPATLFARADELFARQRRRRWNSQ